MNMLRHPGFLIGVVTLFLIASPAVPAQDRCAPNKNLNPSELRGDEAKGGWFTYQNPKNGLTFRYPSSMWVEERNPIPFHLDVTPEVVVDLKGDEPGNPNIIVMRFICAYGQKTPEMAAVKARALLKTHPEENATGRVSGGTIDTMQVDGHEAIVGCGCGRAACSWSVLTLQPRECNIFPMLPGDGNPPPNDARFPILSIIKTIHFKPGVISQQANPPGR
jgi:hypothetical protein